MNSPCKDCNDRQLGCHSKCSKYIAYDRQMEEMRQKRGKMAETISDIASARDRKDKFTKRYLRKERIRY